MYRTWLPLYVREFCSHLSLHNPVVLIGVPITPRRMVYPTDSDAGRNVPSNMPVKGLLRYLAGDRNIGWFDRKDLRNHLVPAFLCNFYDFRPTDTRSSTSILQVYESYSSH
jgi:hypothetical protein